MKITDVGLELKVQNNSVSTRFRRETRHVCALYERCLPPVTVAKVWKLLIECVEELDRRWPSHVINQLGVLTTQIRVDPKVYFAASPEDRKKIALKWLHRGLLKLARASDWNVAPFEAARKGVIKHNYVNEWVWGKTKSSRDRRHKAELFCSFEADRFRAWLRIRDKAGEVVAEELAIDELPSEFCFVPKMGELRWRSSRRVRLLDREGKEVVELSIP
jgi:hypothetical protein